VWLFGLVVRVGLDQQSYSLSGPVNIGVQTGVLGVKPVEKPGKKPAPNLIQFQFVMTVIIKDFFMFTASNHR